MRDEVLSSEDGEQLDVVVQGRPGCKGHKGRIEIQSHLLTER